jgi:zinc transporter ZupT
VARNDLPEAGTLLIAALLLLGLAFAGSWIVAYVQPESDPKVIVPWFLLAAAVIIVVGLIAIIARAHRRSA